MGKEFCKKPIQLRVGVTVLPRGQLVMSEDTAGCHKEEDMLLTPSGQRPWVLLNMPQCTERPQQNYPVPNISSTEVGKHCFIPIYSPWDTFWTTHCLSSDQKGSLLFPR